MRRRLTLYLVAICLVLGVNPKAVAQVPDTWIFTQFDFPRNDVTGTSPYNINDAGDAVGGYTLAGEFNHDHGFLRTRNGEFTPIDVPGANLSVASGINSHGDIAGPYRLATDPMMSRRGFILRNGAFTSFSVPDPNAVDGRAVFTQPLYINDRGDVVGRFCRRVVPVNCTGALGSDTHGFLRTAEGDFFTIDVPGALQTTAWSINNSGQIVGAYWSADDRKIHVFQLSDGQITTIDLPFEPTWPRGGITTRGDIVGTFGDVPFRGFLLSRDGDITVIDFPEAANTAVHGTSPRGDLIVGIYTNSDGDTHSFIASRKERGEEPK